MCFQKEYSTIIKVFLASRGDFERKDILTDWGVDMELHQVKLSLT
jgi:hypothetical protein